MLNSMLVNISLVSWLLIDCLPLDLEGNTFYIVTEKHEMKKKQKTK